MSKQFGKTLFTLVMTSAIASLAATCAAQAADNKIVTVPPEQRAIVPKMNMPEQAMSRAQADRNGAKAAQPLKDAAGNIHYIVTFADGASQPYLNQTAPDPRFESSHDPKVLQLLRETEQVHQIKATHLYSRTIQGFAAFLTPQQVQQLSRDSRIKAVSPNVQVDTSAGGVWDDVAVGSATLPWGIQAVGGGKAATADDSVAIYIVDTGIDVHPDLNVHNRWATNNECITGKYKHGTFVAGVAAAINNNFGVTGVDAGVSLVSLAYGDSTCSPGSQSAANIIAAMEEVKRQIQGRRRIGVVNFSTNIPMIDTIIGVKESIRALITPNPATGYPGAFFVQSAGNQFLDACSYSFNDKLPADGAMVIGAIDNNGQPVQPLNGGMAMNAPKPSVTSIFGPEPGSNFGSCVDAWAPGKNIKSTWMTGNTATYAQGDGTSFAAPHVAGMAAYLIRTNPALVTPSQVETAVRARLVSGGATSGGVAVRTVSLSGQGYAVRPTVEFKIGTLPSSPAPGVAGMSPQAPIYSDANFPLAFDSVGAQNCAIKGYVNGSLWYHAPSVGVRYNWGGPVRLNPGLYRWEATCTGANGMTGTALASAQIAPMPPSPSANFIVDGAALRSGEVRTIPTAQAFTLAFNSTNTTYCSLGARRRQEFQDRQYGWYNVARMAPSFNWGNVRLDPGSYEWKITCLNENYQGRLPVVAVFQMNVSR
ncbi:S8 family serine peptidase [Massilia sp. CCM 8695]|uniref:S8 family serine peptidase n=1 Tax=Massilia frigida TaxID=2609281 RepID=A0ABX0NFW1_9BURK|nr:MULTISPECIES: S8 family serine peptidase [Massilia]MDM5179674.1 S8 family serine peptidase [Massilia sp. DJPM01]NHZ81621.1 S8 family serine peptidase [Massilia frigida]